MLYLARNNNKCKVSSSQIRNLFNYSNFIKNSTTKFTYTTSMNISHKLDLDKGISLEETSNIIVKGYSENEITNLTSTNLEALPKPHLRNILYKLDYFQVDSVIKLLHYIPEETDKIILEYLHKNTYENAMQIFGFHKNISLKTMKKIEQIFHSRFLNFKLNQYLKKEIPFYQFFEFVIFEDKWSISHSIEKLCKNNLLDECFTILNFFKFDKAIHIKPISFNKIIQHKNKQLHSLKQSQNPDENPFEYLKELNLFPLEDSFGPHSEECLKLELDQQKIKFLNSVSDLDLLNVFQNSSLIGIDCEWKPNTNSHDKETQISLMQVADFENVIIIDMLKLGCDQMFVEKFCEIFKNKNFVSFAFFNDLHKMNKRFKSFFEKERKNIIDLSTNSKHGNKSLSKLVNEVFNKSLCKKEQCSNWEIRPLRLKQIHYAALDAHILIKLHNKL